MSEGIRLFTSIREEVRAYGGKRTSEQTDALKKVVARKIIENFDWNVMDVSLRLATFYIAIADSKEGYYSADRGSCEKTLLDDATIDEMYNMIAIRNKDVVSAKEKRKFVMDYMKNTVPGSMEFYEDENGEIGIREAISL